MRRSGPPWAALVAAGAGLLALGFVGAGLDPRRFLQPYLVAFFFTAGAALGALPLLMIHELTGGGWGRLLRPALEAAARTVPWLFAAFLPVLFGASLVYPWAYGAHEGPKAAYLNVPFFAARAVFYFAVWTVLGRMLAARRAKRRPEAVGALGLVAYGFTGTFAAVDWIMSLDPHWFSTIFGLVVLAGHVLLALALAVGATAVSRPDAFREKAAVDSLHDAGNLLLAFLMLWVYMAFSQFLIIWSANLPEETSWYLGRARGGWLGLAACLAVFQFAVPFLLLLQRPVKRDPRRLAAVAALLVAGRLADVLWLAGPYFWERVRDVDWTLVPAASGLALAWTGAYLRAWRARAAAERPAGAR